MKEKRIFQLDGLRLIMCFVVVVNHFEFLSNSSIGEFYNTYLTRGSLAVDFFFILSGFGIYYASQNKDIIVSIKNSLLFAITKIKKIYSLYIVSMLLGAFEWTRVFFLYHKPFIFPKMVEYILSIALCIPLIQSITGMETYTHAFNGVCWFLSSLFISYMFCPLFIKIIKNNKEMKQTLIILTLTIITIYIFYVIADNYIAKLFDGQFSDFPYTFPLIRCLYLLVGMCISRIYIINQGLKCSRIKTVVGVFIYILYFVFKQNIYLSLCNCSGKQEIFKVLDILITSILIYILANGKGKIVNFLSSDMMVKGSKYSMYIFLFHYPIRIIIGDYFKDNNLFNNQMSYVIVIISILVLTFVATIIATKFKDKLRAIFDPKIDKICKLLE